jgi:hypothetical protein
MMGHGGMCDPFYPHFRHTIILIDEISWMFYPFS